ncbi:MAG: Ig-like domain-containing protein [Treponema sp.]|nr:Ig-like domain-containing protein [Treponema sp.]
MVSPPDAANQGVTWKTDNINIATVSSSGRVTGISVGTVTTDDDGYTAECTYSNCYGEWRR